MRRRHVFTGLRTTRLLATPRVQAGPGSGQGGVFDGAEAADGPQGQTLAMKPATLTFIAELGHPTPIPGGWAMVEKMPDNHGHLRVRVKITENLLRKPNRKRLTPRRKSID